MFYQTVVDILNLKVIMEKIDDKAAEYPKVATIGTIGLGIVVILLLVFAVILYYLKCRSEKW